MCRRMLFRGRKGCSPARRILRRMDYKLGQWSIQGRSKASRIDLNTKNQRRIKSMTEPKFIPPLTYPETTKAMTPAFRAKKAMLSLISSFIDSWSLTDKRFRELKKGWNDKECNLVFRGSMKRSPTLRQLAKPWIANGVCQARSGSRASHHQ